ncbi:RagB/SusD family nutrient uptake outer membrane protein [Sphingobacterium mizutaii]|uniref:RagB/SusD family nutrient uptake outer membrane protein n=1 Tax=Sphingobacterium mizutaii TaxID=1010 RepID=UPI00162966AD|nr:RagB/SusD family nutrient uptake outer membrane protein [Sphingobacterium mizutaii]
MKRKILSILAVVAYLSFTGCEKFLDEKPDKKLVVPSTVQDAQALMNKTDVFTTMYPASGEFAAGDFYLLTEDWQSLTEQSHQQSYIWGDDVFNEYERNDWSLPYVAVYNSNVILDAITKGEIKKGTQNQIDDIRGQALFFRSYAFYSLLQIFSKAWDNTTSNTDPGIPLRLSSDFNIPTTRSNVAECYEQIINDTKEAVYLLNKNTTLKTRPSKAAAYAFLSRVYLNIGKYEEALSSANNALSFNNVLIDYNILDPTAEFPFALFNEEVIYHASLRAYLPYPPSPKIEPELFASYNNHDLRKSLLFLNNDDGSSSYKAGYNGDDGLFNGLATNELYLIRAECYARLGNTSQALENLNTLLAKRWLTGYFIPFSVATPDEALEIILQERRKELIFRGLRWSDLKRLNKDPRFAVTLTRTVEDKEYRLPPNDNRYLFQIPAAVIEMTGIEQNPR